MPHFGLMSTEESFKQPEGALLRARLHIRAGRRRFRQGKISAGVVTLYDALIFALRWYLTSPEHGKEFNINAVFDLTDEREMIGLLREAGTLDLSFDLDAFETLVDRAASDEMAGYDYSAMLSQFESLMDRLGVTPFAEELLPPEDPSVF